MCKKMVKKVLCVLCTAALIVTGIPSPLRAAAAVEEGVEINDNTTAMSADGYSFDHAYVKPGDTLKVLHTQDAVTEEVTENVLWTVKKVVSGQDGNKVVYETVKSVQQPALEITEEYLESVIYGAIGDTKLTIYCSKTPVIYINSETNYYDVTKDYTEEENTSIKLVGNDTYQNEDYWYDGTGQVKLRGNSTAYRPKRPFKLKLSEKADLLGLGAEQNEDGTSKSYTSKHWVLLANDIDHSLLRNKLLYDFSGDIGTEFYFKSTNVTLIYNGQYEGVYQLCEHRRVDPGRIDITDWTGIGEDAADTIGKAVAKENGWDKTKRKEFISELETIMASDYSWIDEKRVTYDAAGSDEVEKIAIPDLSCGNFAEAKTDWISLTGDFSLSFEFHNKGYKTNQEYDNFVVELASQDEANYLTAVCNGNIWWYNGENAAAKWEGNISNICNDRRKDILADADVKLSIKRIGNRITMHGDITGANGKTTVFDASAQNDFGFPEMLKLHLTGEDCDLTNISYYENPVHVYDFADYDITLPDTTGGFLAEMDFYSIGDNTLASIATNYKQPMYFSAPEPGEDAETDAEKRAIVNSFKSTSLFEYAKNYTQAFEYALHSDDFYFNNGTQKYYTDKEGSREKQWKDAHYTAVTYTDHVNDGKHYSELFDMDSLVNNFLFCEYAMNWDSMKNSFFFYKDVGELAKFGPQWDFDWCWGNTNMFNINTNYPTSWQTTIDKFTEEQYYQTVQWNRMLIRDPYFLTLAYEKYHKIRPVIENMIKKGGLIDQYKTDLKEAGAANDVRWCYTYNTEYSGATSQNFEDSVASIQTFLNKRVEWLDKQFASVSTLVNSLGYYKTSDDIFLSGKVDGDKVTFTAETKNSEAAKIRFQMNGTTCLTADVKDGKASVSVDKSKLKASGLNTVVANEMDKNDSYLYLTSASKTGNYNVVKSDYMAFDLTNPDSMEKERPADFNNEKSEDKKEEIAKEPDTSSNGVNDSTTTTSSNEPKISKVTVKAANRKAGTKTVYLKKGGKLKLAAVVTGMGSFGKAVTWVSSKKAVASVSAKGTVKAKKAGTTKITVTSAADKTKKATITVKVSKKAKPNKKLSLKAKRKTLKKGKTYTVAIKSMTKRTTDSVTYKSSKKSVVSVDQYGLAKAKKKGTATITVKCGKKKAKLKVKVNN